MSPRSITYSETLTVVTCWCGMKHAIPEALEETASRDHNHGVYCPLGHRWVFAGKTEAQKLADELAREKASNAALTARLDQERASHAWTKGQLTKAKKRAAGGACPCCNRSFVDVARHMKSKHPDYAAPPA